MKGDIAALGPGSMSSSSEVAGSGSELSVKDRETARRNFKRVSSMQREQLGLAGQPLPDAPLPEGITPEQLFPGHLPMPPSSSSSISSSSAAAASSASCLGL